MVSNIVYPVNNMVAVAICMHRSTRDFSQLHLLSNHRLPVILFILQFKCKKVRLLYCSLRFCIYSLCYPICVLLKIEKCRDLVFGIFECCFFLLVSFIHVFIRERERFGVQCFYTSLHFHNIYSSIRVFKRKKKKKTNINLHFVKLTCNMQKITFFDCLLDCSFKM